MRKWKTIYLLNIDLKLISKVFAKRIKKLLPSLISCNQTPYVENRLISERSRLVFNVLEVTDIF